MVASRSAAQRAIAESRVVVDGMPAAKSATLVDQQSSLRLVTVGEDWAGRGAFKLLGAVDAFDVDIAGRDALDVGASTGGFTDVLLRRGAASVAAVDVGYGQLAWRLQEDPRVRVFDRVNFRTADLAALGAPFDVVVVDVSFISVALLAGQLAAAGTTGTDYVVLVKPQFEVGRTQVGRGGIVRDPAVRAAAIRSAAGALSNAGLAARNLCPSPIEGAKGNVEFFLHLRPGEGPGLDDDSIARAVAS
jgi:23S rRNA (cytidine1920-2'-O)/16S rRNA (cytidine1409-2'-O)-methyltransferase